MSDYIKREDAITELRKRVHRFTVADEIGYTGTVKWSEEVIYETSAMNGLMSIPAADVVERKRGKWIVLNDEYIDNCKCSECGCIEYFNKGWKRFNFCPNCGAEMESADDV